MESAHTLHSSSRLRFALKNVAWHLLISLILAGLAALLVFGVWYPYPYAELTSGLALYKLVISVDIVCGPLLTLILASPSKKLKERVIDFSLIGMIQLAALIYGLYSVSLARPVVAAFETDRINVVTAAEIDVNDLSHAPKDLQDLPWFGVRRVGLREATSPDEANQSLDLSLKGIEPSMRPSWWLPDSQQEREKIRKAMKPLFILVKARGMNEDSILEQASLINDGKELYFLPFTSARSKEWIVILNDQADFLGYAPIDGFIK